MAIEIKKGVPMPDSKDRSKLSEYAQALIKMEIEDSFEFTTEDLKKVRGAIKTAQVRAKEKNETAYFETRTLPAKDGVAYSGVWKVKDAPRKPNVKKKEKVVGAPIPIAPASAQETGEEASQPIC